MPLTRGDKLGPYEILTLIGVGGMGEVYRAHDPRLRRDVAIKVSKEQFTDRFEREAHAVAALNHPNIAQLYDIGPNYLVMEYVEGESPEGPLPLAEAVRVAAQIADALEAAHQKNIVHRDLKPANIKITPEGVVKVLDFGLAKTFDEPGSTTSAPGDSPTLTLGTTRAGTILGTAAYMAPEQARGRPVDKRADIWAFGAVFYEILTGRRAFPGDDVSDILASVLKLDPDWKALPADTPAHIQRLIRRCLEKDRKHRLRDIGDARLDLDLPADEPVTSTSRHSAGLRLAIILAAMLAVALAALAVIHFRETSLDQRVLRLSVPLPPNTTPGFLALSPDGRRLVALLVTGGKSQLWLRSLDSPQFQPLSGTDNARTPFWSADSRFIGFFADGKLKTVPAAGGPAQSLCGETGLGSGGAWNRDDVILFGSETGPLQRVNAVGGDCTPVTKADPGGRQGTPEFLPDGKHFLYYRGTSDESSRGVYVAALDNPSARKLLSDNSSAIYAPPAAGARNGHLLFLREGTLMAQSFDAEALQLLGDPFPVATQASVSYTPPQVAASIALNGTLAYLANRSQETQLTWLDRSGKELGKAGPHADQFGVSLSPDGNTVAISRRNQGVWLYDLFRGSENRFATSTGQSAAAVWSPDGSRIVLSAASQGLTIKPANGTGQEESLLKSTDSVRASDWSRDGRFLIYTQIDAKANADIWYLPDPGKPESKPVKFLGTDALESEGQLSPDGHWIAYVSNETGKLDVYIRPFPSGPGQWKVSVSSGREPRWSRDGKELYYLDIGAPDTRLLAASIQTDGRGGLKVGAPQKLFEYRGLGIVPQSNAFAYSPHPDGKRFLVNVEAETAPPSINIITNWQAAK
jgi:serine/threonine protein kinase